MENERQQQIDALVMASEYIEKLIPAMETVISEINGEMQEDTVDFLMQITDGFNFMIEVYNATSKLINGDEVLVNDDVLEETIKKLSSGFNKKDYKIVADEYEAAIIPFLKVFKQAADNIINA